MGDVSSTLGKALAANNLTIDQLVVQINSISIESAIHTVGIVNFGLCTAILVVSLFLLKKKPVVTKEPTELTESL